MIHLDRLVSSVDVTKVYAGGKTTWTLPFAVPIDGSEGELVAVAGASVTGHSYGDILTTVRDSNTTISVDGEDLTEDEVFIGIRYSLEYEMSRIYIRKDKTNAAAVADTRGKLQLRTLEVNCAEAQNLNVTVAALERTPVTYTSPMVGAEHVRVPVMSNNEQVTITLTSDSPLGVRVFSAAWEGFWHSRNITR